MPSAAAAVSAESALLAHAGAPRRLGLLLLAVGAAFYAGALKLFFDNRFLQLIPDALFAVMLLLAAADRVAGWKRIPDGARALRIAVCLFIAIAAAQMFNPNIPSLEAGLEGFRKTAFYFIALLIGLSIEWDNRAIRLLLSWVLALGIPLCLYSLKQHFAPSRFDYDIVAKNFAGDYTWILFGAYRASSLFSSPFVLGCFGNVLLAVSLFGYAVSGRKLLYAGTATIAVLSIFVSLTRASLVTAAVVLVVSAALYRRGKLSLKYAVAGALLIASLAVLVSFLLDVPIFADFVGSLDPRTIQSDRAFSRLASWATALALMSGRWLTGYGTGSAGSALDRYFATGVQIEPHNMFVLVTFEQGLLGFIVLLFILGKWFTLNRAQRARASDPEVRSVYDLGLVVAIALVVTGLTSGALDMFPANMLAYLLMGATSRPITGRW